MLSLYLYCVFLGEEKEGSSFFPLFKKNNNNAWSQVATDVIQLTLTQKMATARFVKTSVNFNNLEDYIPPTYDSDYCAFFKASPGAHPFSWKISSETFYPCENGEQYE